MQIPDLRRDDTITPEHCYVLLEKFGDIWADGYGEDIKEVVNQIDPNRMVEQFSGIMSKRRFFHLFSTDEGKLVLIGMFFQKFVMEGFDASQDQNT